MLHKHQDNVHMWSLMTGLIVAFFAAMVILSWLYYTTSLAPLGK